MKVRDSSVAGSFYPGKKEELSKQLIEFFESLESENKSRCIVSPHAGYKYSGKIAALAFNSLEQSKTVVVLSPNHTGLGEEISVSDADYWETPLGRVEVDTKLRENLLEILGIAADDLAHIGEHSIEVQVPFIQFLFPKAKILPITLMGHKLENLVALGEAIFNASKGKVSVVASSDFSHFIPEQEAKERDLEAIGLIERMDAEGFHSLVLEKKLSICGFAPIVVAIVFAKKLGMKNGKLLEYDSSASATRDKENVVGYAAIKFE